MQHVTPDKKLLMFYLQVYLSLLQEVSNFKGSGREVHPFFFLKSGFRFFLIREDAATKKFLQ